MKRPSLAEKDFLTPSEAAEYYMLSRRKFFIFLDEKSKRRCEFLALYGERKLIIKDAFVNYLIANPDVKEELRNARSNKEIHEERLKAQNPS